MFKIPLKTKFKPHYFIRTCHYKGVCYMTDLTLLLVLNGTKKFMVQVNVPNAGKYGPENLRIRTLFTE